MEKVEFYIPIMLTKEEFNIILTSLRMSLGNNLNEEERIKIKNLINQLIDFTEEVAAGD